MASKAVWNISIGVMVATVVGTIIVVVVVLSGATDPQPVGELVVDDDLQDVNVWQDLEIDMDEIPVVRALQSEAIYLVSAPYDFTMPGTIEIVGRQLEGSSVSAYGLWWRGSTSELVIVAVNGNGYFGISALGEDGSRETIHAWRPFPHVQRQTMPNTIRIDFWDGQAQVRINEEIVSSFAWTTTGTHEIGLYMETFEAGGAVTAFERLRLWEDRD